MFYFVVNSQYSIPSFIVDLFNMINIYKIRNRIKIVRHKITNIICKFRKSTFARRVSGQKKVRADDFVMCVSLIVEFD